MRFLMLPLTLVFAHAAVAAPTGLLNDTGQDTCYDGTSLVASTGNSGDAAAYPRQDGRFGRDAKAAAGTLTKVGGGAAGFDFSKMCWNGDVEGSGTCTGTLVANTTATATGSPTTDWACTKDNVTNLIWSLQRGFGDWTTYATTTYPAAMNIAGRCGFTTGWRLPTRRELISIVHYGTFQPAIDSAYFPGTGLVQYWSADTLVNNPANAWVVYSDYGSTYDLSKAVTDYVRLVRSGQ